MAEVKLDLKTWTKMLGQIKFDKAAERGLLSGALRAIPVLHRATDVAPPASDSPRSTKGASNTGRFRGSWKSARIERGVSIFNKAPYAPIVEGGRRKGAKMPPPKAIAKWAQRRTGVTKEEAQRLAFIMARAIKTRGLKARNILKTSMPQIKKLMIEEVLREMRLELAGK
jgi:hypothetical protein